MKNLMIRHSRCSFKMSPRDNWICNSFSFSLSILIYYTFSTAAINAIYSGISSTRTTTRSCKNKQLSWEIIMKLKYTVFILYENDAWQIIKNHRSVYMRHRVYLRNKTCSFICSCIMTRGVNNGIFHSTFLWLADALIWRLSFNTLTM